MFNQIIKDGAEACVDALSLEGGAAQKSFIILENNPGLMQSEGSLAKAVEKVKKINNDLAEMYKNTTLGKGSTGRMFPKDLKELFAMKETLSNPLNEAMELQSLKMTDIRWQANDGWVKMSKNVTGVEIHFVYNTITKVFDDFKFK